MTNNMTAAQVAAAFERSANTIQERVAPIVAKGAGNVAQDARNTVRASKQWKPTNSGNDPQEFAARSLGFDAGDPDDLDVVIGYDTREVPEVLAQAVEYGSVNTSPGGQLGKSLNREAPRYLKAMLRVGSEIWR